MRLHSYRGIHYLPLTAPEYKKSPMPWGFHSTRLSWFAMLFWASEMLAVTLN